MRDNTTRTDRAFVVSRATIRPFHLILAGRTRSVVQGRRDLFGDGLNELVDRLAANVQLPSYAALRQTVPHQIPRAHLTTGEIRGVQPSQRSHRFLAR
jgi:hypothetical protein